MACTTLDHYLDWQVSPLPSAIVGNMRLIIASSLYIAKDIRTENSKQSVFDLVNVLTLPPLCSFFFFLLPCCHPVGSLRIGSKKQHHIPCSTQKTGHPVVSESITLYTPLISVFSVALRGRSKRKGVGK